MSTKYLLLQKKYMLINLKTFPYLTFPFFCYSKKITQYKLKSGYLSDRLPEKDSQFLIHIQMNNQAKNDTQVEWGLKKQLNKIRLYKFSEEYFL